MNGLADSGLKLHGVGIEVSSGLERRACLYRAEQVARFLTAVGLCEYCPGWMCRPGAPGHAYLYRAELVTRDGWEPWRGTAWMDGIIDR